MSNTQLLVYDGWLADDPEMRFINNGTAVTNFRIGSSRQYKKSNGELQKETTWLKIAVWGAQAEYVKAHCKKGTRVLVEGRLRPGENGSPETFQLSTGGYGASYEVTATRVNIISGGVFENSDQQSSDDSLPY